MEEEQFDLIENLHSLSNRAINIPLVKLKGATICSIDDFYAFEDFLEADHTVYQNALLETPDNKINLILKNFDKAIAAQCGNQIDLSNLKLIDNFSYCRITDYKERSTSKRYKIKDIIPEDVELFKKYWLLHFLSNCRNIVWNIRDILGKPQPVFHKPQNILKLCDDTEKKEASLKDQSIALFSSSKPRQELLNQYYKNILPQSIEITDDLFLALEQMQESFADKLGYLVFEKDNLDKLIASYKLNYLDRFESTIDKIKIEDKPTFLSAYQNEIKNLKLKNEIKGKSISRFTEQIESKIDIILQQPFSDVIIENPLQMAAAIKIDDFKTIVTSDTKREYIYNILEHFGAINSERISILTERKKGVLRGVVEALMDCKVLPQSGLHNLCSVIAKDIKLELGSKLDYHDTAKKIHNEAKRYIKDNPLH